MSTKKGYKILKFHYWNSSRKYSLQSSVCKIVYKIVLYANNIKKRIVRFFFSKEHFTRFLRFCFAFGIIISSYFIYQSPNSVYLESGSQNVMQAQLVTNSSGTSYLKPHSQQLAVQSESGIFYNELQPSNSIIADYPKQLENIKSSFWNSLKENTTLSIGFDTSSAYKPVCTYLSSSNTPVQRLADRNRNWLAYRLTQIENISQNLLHASFTPFVSFELDTSQNESFKHAKSCVKGLYVPGHNASRLSYCLQVPSPITKKHYVQIELGTECKRFDDRFFINPPSNIVSCDFTVNYLPNLSKRGYLSLQLSHADVLKQNKRLFTKEKKTSVSLAWKFTATMSKTPTVFP